MFPQIWYFLFKVCFQPFRFALEGVLSHFPCAKQINNKEKTRQQLQIFQEQIEKAKQIGIDFDILHIANTTASLSLPETHLDIVRIGMGMVVFA